ncbi:MAG: cytochrome P450 [Gammaproteobacteria bacterium]|nr:cytochrome P450 [Gammaproteobacteria bacterium]RZV50043.1 MAG: cytochrome P450 [Pseudomonadales bacterium]
MSKCPFANLLDVDLYTQGMPYEELAKYRQAGSLVYRDDPVEGVPYWAAVKRDAVDFISMNPALFSSELEGPFPMEMSKEETWPIIRDNQIICMDPPKHQRYRKIVRDAFTAKAVKAMQPWLDQKAKEIIDNVAHRGECEAVEELAAELPLMAILEIMGVPQDERKQFFEWTNIMAFRDDPDVTVDPDEAMVASANVLMYATELAARQRENPTSMVAQSLLEGEVDGVPVSDEMFGWMFILILVGGNESTRSVTSQGLRLLMEHPEQLQHLVDHPEDIHDAVEEIIRYNTAFVMMRRTATEDVELCGETIKKGDKVVMHYHAVNHDEDVFGDDSMSFDIHRAKRMKNFSREHRSFGIGEHFCLGMNLARAELRTIFKELIPRMRNPQFAGDLTYMRSYFTSTIKSMPIRFDAEVA